MRKFLSVVKHEYKKIVLKWSFLLATLLFPLLAAAFAVVPALIFSIKGEATRIIVADQTGKIASRVRENLSSEKMAVKASEAQKDALKNLNASQEEQMKRSAEQMGVSFNFVEYVADGKSVEQLKRELNTKITEKEIDAYLIVPANYESSDAKFEFFSRKAGDFVANSSLEKAINSAVRSQRLADADISEDKLKDLSRNVDLSVKKVSEEGDEKDDEGSFAAGVIIGLMIYITLLIYGQQIMSAVVEEKETRIAEILFSSAKPFELMMGKLVGVGLAGLTQLAIWVVSALVLVGVGIAQMSAAGINITIPDITALTIIYFFIFFLLGFFIYATIYALIGSMVTNVQEGGQFAMFPVFILIIGFYLSFAVIRDPNSNVSFWVSIAPFFAPIVMPVRILAETPPFWQIALAILLNSLAIAGLVWLAARVYRVGMLMYGKRATIPEVWKWIRQS
ncbi:MAG: ABC transporter permease [Acidobacteria bacterium]|jgi:ABC-2 type transport system permease protein|nr:ABC transporter permease [Acidobacteriota bacterium]